MPPKHSSLPLYFPDWTIVMLCSLVYRNTFLIDFKESKMQLQDSQSKLPNQTILLPFCTHSIGCQSQLEFSTKYPPSVTVLCQIPVLNICPGSCGFIHHRDNSVRPVTTAFFVFPPSKQKPLVKGPFHMLVLWSGTNFHMTSGVHSQKPHSSKPSKPICLARTTSLTVFVLFATPVAGWVSRLGYIFRAPSPSPPPFFVVFDQCCWLLYCCWLPSRALLSSLLLSCCTQCYCEALRAQTRWGALEVLFIIIIIN